MSNAPNSVPGGLGVPKASIANVLIASFNDLASVEQRFKQNPGEIARHHSRAHHDERGLVHAAAGISGRPARDLPPRTARC